MGDDLAQECCVIYDAFKEHWGEFSASVDMMRQGNDKSLLQVLEFTKEFFVQIRTFYINVY